MKMPWSKGREKCSMVRIESELYGQVKEQAEKEKMPIQKWIAQLIKNFFILKKSE